MTEKKFFGKGPPRVNLSGLKGKLIVIEGADGSGRSTQIGILHDWLEKKGYATTMEVGLKRSELIGQDLYEVKQGNSISGATLSLFYATDFADQLEKKIIPALRAGFLVLADRYIFTLMARAIVRGADAGWIRRIYGVALEPDVVFYLKTSPEILVERSFQKSGSLNYWESGMDVFPSQDLYSSFIRYQRLIQKTLLSLGKEYKFVVINGALPPAAVARQIETRMERILAPGRAKSKA
jgi:dTMP kinase